MKGYLLGFLVICTICVLTATGAFAFKITALPITFIATKWDPGVDSASDFNANNPPVDGPGLPGGATWSIMAPGHDVPYGDIFHPGGAQSVDFLGLVSSSGGSFPDGNTSTSFPSGSITGAQNGFWPGLSPGDPVPYELWAVDAALDQWSAVSGFSNLGPVADGDGGTAENSIPPNYPDWNGNGASDLNGGDLGDIRIAAYNFLDAYLADTYQPGTEDSFGYGGNIGGDAHFAAGNSENFSWIDNPSHDLDSATNQYDFYTNILHEMGHALGLDHPDDVNRVVMDQYTDRRTALRTLTDDDIAGARAIYGPNDASVVPEPGTILLLAIGLLTIAGINRKKYIN